jgi:hypothetical protein
MGLTCAICCAMVRPMNTKAKALKHYQNLERTARMNATAYGLLQAIARADTPRTYPFAAECEIHQLGVTWIASIGFEATCYDGSWEIDDYSVEIAPKGRENTDQWVEIDMSELSESAQRDITSACMQELEGVGGSQEDASYDAWKERDL